MKNNLPFAPGQLWSNALYRKSLDYDHTLNLKTKRRSFIENVLTKDPHTTQPKFFMADHYYDGVSFCSSLAQKHSSRAIFLDTFFGNPINYQVFDCLFDGTTPAGYHNPDLSNQIWSVLRSTPFLEYTVTRNSKPLVPYVSQGEHFSGTFITTGNCGQSNSGGYRQESNRSYFDKNLVDIEYSAVNTSSELKDYNVLTFTKKGWNGLLTPISDFLIHLSNFNDKNIGSLILPSGSVIWYWDESQTKWITCSVDYVIPEKIDGKIEVKFFAVAEDGSITDKVVYSSKSKEITIHKTIAKLIDTDAIRIVVKNIRGLASSGNNKIISARFVTFLINNFSSPILNQVKTFILDSTSHKNITTFSEFYQELRKRSLYKIDYSKYSQNALKFARKSAYLAALNNTPFCWEFEYKQELNGSSDSQWANEINAIRELGLMKSQRNICAPYGYINGKNNSRIIYNYFCLNSESVKLNLSEVSFDVELNVKKIIVNYYDTVITKKVFVPQFFARENNKDYLKHFIQKMTNICGSVEVDEELEDKLLKTKNLNDKKNVNASERIDNVKYISVKNINLKSQNATIST